MVETKTVRRDWLKKQVEKGNVLCRTAFSFTDGEPYEEPDKNWLPARIKQGHGDFVEGFYNMLEFDFRSKSGSAYWSGEDTIHLHVHSNYSVECKIVDRAKGG